LLSWYQSFFLRYGLKAEAVLETENIFTKLTLEKMIDTKKVSNIQTVKFPNFEEARSFSADFAKKLWETYPPNYQVPA
jgi:hypothetical protein